MKFFDRRFWLFELATVIVPAVIFFCCPYFLSGPKANFMMYVHEAFDYMLGYILPFPLAGILSWHCWKKRSRFALIGWLLLMLLPVSIGLLVGYDYFFCGGSGLDKVLYGIIVMGIFGGVPMLISVVVLGLIGGRLIHRLPK